MWLVFLQVANLLNQQHKAAMKVQSVHCAASAAFSGQFDP